MEEGRKEDYLFSRKGGECDGKRMPQREREREREREII